MKTPIVFLLFATALQAWGQPCDPAVCGASGLPAKALAEATRADTNKPQPGILPAIREEQRRTAQSDDPWNRHMPTRPDLESYDCILSFGIGGELGKGGFLGARALGRTQVLREGAKP